MLCITFDPDNRLVAAELERRWNSSLAAVCVLEEELQVLLRQRPVALSAEERERLLRMGHDLAAAWHHPSATTITRKRITRAVLREVVARVEGDQIQLLLHWQGGDHTPLTVKKAQTVGAYLGTADTMSAGLFETANRRW
jgi:hypothetical protein